MNLSTLYNKKDDSKIIEKINEIAEYLYDNNKKEISLFGGRVGIALFFMYYAKYTDKQESYDYALETFLSVFEDINNKSYSFHTHASGLAGIGTIVEILAQEDFIDAYTEELLGSLDEYLYQLMMAELKKENYDFLHGATGLALYFYKRESCKNRTKYLLDFVDELEKIAHKDEKGIRWLSELNREESIKGYNLSLSHGIASIIVFLSKLYKSRIAKEKVSWLLKGTVEYLLNQQLDTSIFRSNFPSWVSISKILTQSRLAWCYGDLGIGIALWLAGKNANNSKWQNKALEILLHTTQRKDLKEDFVLDAGLCHGTAGIAHIYNRMFNYTQRDEFKQAALYWFDQTLKMAKFEDGLAGYKTWRSFEYGGWQNDYGLLTGIAGIGLALISAVSDIEPAWDECLLLS